MEEEEFKKLIKQMEGVKAYDVTFDCTVRRTGIVYASNEQEAKENFDKGNIIKERDLDCLDVELVKIEQSEGT